MKGGTVTINSLEETLERWICDLEYRGLLRQNPAETVFISESLNRITAEPARAEISVPHFYMASLDGVALNSSRTFGADPDNPVCMELGETAVFVDTGMPLPMGFDCIAPLNEVKLESVNAITLERPFAPWENVRPLGEEVVATEIMTPAGHRISPFDMALLYSGGLTLINVVKKPVIAVLPVGDTLVPAGARPDLGQVMETSSLITGNMAEELGCMPLVFDIVSESPEKIMARLEEIESMDEKPDILCIIGGPSHGTALIADILERRGELLTHGLQIKPGGSACLGLLKDIPVVGLPLYAASSFIAFELFAKPVIFSKLGIRPRKREMVNVRLISDMASPPGVVEFTRVSVGDVNGRGVAVPISRGANILTSLARADGILRIPSDVTLMEENRETAVELLRPLSEIKSKIIIAGSHDICFDLLRNQIQENFPELCLIMSNMGSLRGLQTLKKGLCHCASIHDFDSESGEFNIPLVREIIPEIPVILVNLFHRDLGFMVSRGNPKKIYSFRDLTREDVVFVNRIKTSGTRRIFDYHIRKNNIDPSEIRGYENELETHLSVATAVASGNAHAGIGILPAAKATDLDFVALVPERLDLVIPRKNLSSYRLQGLLSLILREGFKQQVEQLGGYRVGETGKIIYES